jgi:hypothetical protein
MLPVDSALSKVADHGLSESGEILFANRPFCYEKQNATEGGSSKYRIFESSQGFENLIGSLGLPSSNPKPCGLCVLCG